MWKERKLAKMLCFEAHRNQSLGEGTCPKDCEGADPKIPPLQQS